MSIILVNLILIVAAAVQGSIGFGMGLLAVPLMVLVDPVYVPIPFLFAALVFNLLVMARERRGIRFGIMIWAVGGRAIGAILGGILIALFIEKTLLILIGSIILLGVLMSISGLHVPIEKGSLVLTGVLSGIMGTVAAVGDPPMGLLFQREEGTKMRGNLAAFFLFGSLISISAILITNPDQINLAVRGFEILPGILIGFLISRWLVPIVDRGYTRPAVLTISTIAGLLVIIRELF